MCNRLLSQVQKLSAWHLQEMQWERWILWARGKPRHFLVFDLTNWFTIINSMPVFSVLQKFKIKTLSKYLNFFKVRCLCGMVQSERWHHRVDRVLSFLFSCPNWDYPTPSHAGECVPSPFGSGGKHTRLREGGGGPNSNEGTDTVVL